VQPNHYVVRDANRQQLAYVYFRERTAAALSGQAADEGRGAKDRGEHCEVTRPIAQALMLARVPAYSRRE